MTILRSLALLFVLCTMPLIGLTQGNVDLARYPSIAPDGETIVFSWRGDLWSVSSEGGPANRLTTHEGIETYSAWNADGSRIAFQSNRGGEPNIYRMTPQGTDIEPVTRQTLGIRLAGFGENQAGEEVVFFHGRIEGDIYRHGRPYQVSLAGGEPARLHDAFGEYPALQPGGDQIAFVRGRASWWRRHYRGSNSQNLWLYDRSDASFTQLTERRGNDGMPRWADGWLYFLSDRQDRCVNVYRMQPDDPITIERLTQMRNQDVYYFDVSADGKTLVYSSMGKLYVQQSDQLASQLAITAKEDTDDFIDLLNVSDEVSEAQLSPDGQVMAYVAHGEVFVRNIDEFSPSRAVTDSVARERDLAWSPDGLALYFVSDRSGNEGIYQATVQRSRHEIAEAFEQSSNPQSATAEVEEATSVLPPELDPKRWHDAVAFTIEKVINSEAVERRPDLSPDGRHLIYLKEIGDLMVLDLESGETQLLVEGWDFGIDYRWSPDGQWIAYAQNDLNFNEDIYIVPVDGSQEPVNITRHPDNDVMPRWSADGKILAFASERIDEEYDVWMVYLDKSL